MLSNSLLVPQLNQLLLVQKPLFLKESLQTIPCFHRVFPLILCPTRFRVHSFVLFLNTFLINIPVLRRLSKTYTFSV